MADGGKSYSAGTIFLLNLAVSERICFKSRTSIDRIPSSNSLFEYFDAAEERNSVFCLLLIHFVLVIALNTSNIHRRIHSTLIFFDSMSLMMMFPETIRNWRCIANSIQQRVTFESIESDLTRPAISKLFSVQWVNKWKCFRFQKRKTNVFRSNDH